MNITKFDIMDDYDIREVKLEDDYAIGIVRIFVDKKLTYQSFTDGKDFDLFFKLMKDKDGEWKITDQLNRGNNWPYDNKVHFMDFEVVFYLPSLIEYLYETDAHLYTLDQETWKKMVKTLETYYHNKYLLNRKALQKFTLKELQVLRNSIFAYYGREFQTPWLQEYFDGKLWYKVDSDYSDTRLTPNDLSNIELIRQVEQSYSPQSIDDLLKNNN